MKQRTGRPHHWTWRVAATSDFSSAHATPWQQLRLLFVLPANVDPLEQLRSLQAAEQFVHEMRTVLQGLDDADNVLRAALRSDSADRPNALPRINLDRVYHRRVLRRLCVHYRLRFLTASAYKGSVSSRSLAQVRQLEEEAGKPLRGFRWLAPPRAFEQRNSSEGMLFIPLTKDHFYLIGIGESRWPVWRSWLFWPLRSAVHLAACVALLAALLAVLMPGKGIALAAGGPVAQRLFLLLWFSAVLGSFTAYGWFAFFGRFNHEAWDLARRA
jgi:hypothetical protein